MKGFARHFGRPALPPFPNAGTTDRMSDSLFDREVAKFRQVLTTGRSSIFLQLFDFLVARSGDDRAPKEVEIALAVFGRNGEQGDLPDSVVRVSMHRLRKRLDAFYAGQPGARLQIPKGEYRLVLSDHPVPPAAPPGPSWPVRLAARGSRFWLGVLVAVVLLNAALWWVIAPGLSPNGSTNALRSTTFWRALTPGAPAVIAIGDSYVLAETDNGKDVKRLIMEPAIRSRDDFGGYMTTHPSTFYTLYDLDVYYTPVGTAAAAWNILPPLSALLRDGGVRPRLMSASRLKPPTVEGSDVIYIGPLASLGILTLPVSQASGFTMSLMANELVDRTTGKHYAMETGGSGNKQAGIDYGYIATMPGPAGKRIFVIAGLGSTAVQSMADLVADPVQLAQLSGRAGLPTSFEALYEVRTAGNVVFGRTLVVARPLQHHRR